MNVRDVLGGILLAVFFAWMWFWGVRMGVNHAPGQGLTPTAPSLFPYILSAIGFTFSVAMAIGAWAAPASSSSEFSDGGRLPLIKVLARAAILLAVFAAYYLAFKSLGALLTSMLVFGPLLFLGGERRPGWLIGTAICLPLGTHFIFAKLAHVPLPRGLLPF